MQATSNQTTLQTAKNYALLTLGTLLMAVGIYFFKFPNNFSTGGVTGISIVLGHFLPSITPATLVMIINIALLIVGFAIFGRSFGLRTVYCSLLLSGALWVLERVAPLTAPMTTQPLLELIFAVSFPAVGSAILFNLDASSGGTDIVAMVLRKYTSINIGKALMYADFLVTLSACFTFGMETGLFSILGLIIKGMVVDLVLENFNVCKCFQIITDKPEEILAYITGKLRRGATKMHGEGAYTHEDKTVILTVVNRTQAVHLRQFAKQTDPHCFILITNTGEIIGKGFRGLM